MAVVRKKQDDKYLLALRELVASGNRQCFDCGQKGPTYVNMTIGSFVCTRCSGVLRGLTPPHRVKSISMATFTQDEIDFLRTHGNELCAKTWLGLWDPKRAGHQQEQRELMVDKYERKRYYLEPASPLKSLANAVNLKSTQNGHHTQQHNGYASIHLTPPAAQRTAANGLQKANSTSSNSSSSISRPQHHHNHSSSNNNHDAFGLNGSGGGGLSSLNSAGSTSTGALSDTSSCASNGFGADSDFVADFGSATIFDATSARSAGSPAVSSVSSVGSSNGYAKVQPLRAAHLQQQQQQLQQQQQQLQQQQQQLLLNGNGHQGTENFADFDHAPIFNAVAATTFHDWVSDWSRRGFHDPFDDCDEPSPPAPPPPAVPVPLPTVREEPELAWNFWQEEMRIEEERAREREREQEQESQRAMSYSTFSSPRSCSSSIAEAPPPPMPYSPSNPFLPYLVNQHQQQQQHPNPPEEPPASFSYLLFSSISSSSHEDQYQAAADDDQKSNILNANFHDLFTWSAPLQNGGSHATTSPPKSTAAMAPSEDRYAALKDLDEQLRELKASEASASEAPTPTNGHADAFGSALNNNPNPFKSQQQQQQQLSSHVVNPFQHQQQQQQQQQQNLYGQLTLIPNAYGSSPQQQMGHLLQQQQQQQLHQHQANFFNFNNNNGFGLSQGLPNGCGFGSMQPAPVMVNNPFAASSGAMNTNNPFL